MAKKATGSTTPGDVSAAHQWLEDAAMKISRHQAALKTHSATLEDENEELTAKLADQEAQYNAAMASAAERYTRDTEALKGKVLGLEKKLDRVKADLS